MVMPISSSQTPGSRVECFDTKGKVRVVSTMPSVIERCHRTNASRCVRRVLVKGVRQQEMMSLHDRTARLLVRPARMRQIDDDRLLGVPRAFHLVCCRLSIGCLGPAEFHGTTRNDCCRVGFDSQSSISRVHPESRAVGQSVRGELFPHGPGILLLDSAAARHRRCGSRPLYLLGAASRNQKGVVVGKLMGVVTTPSTCRRQRRHEGVYQEA